MAAEKGASKMDGVVKLVIIFFVCLLSFSIGTFVGKKFSDNQHKVAEFEPAGGGEHDRDIASVQPDSTEIKPSDALSDDEVAKLAEEFVSDEHKEEAHGDSHGGGHEATPVTDKNSEVREAKASGHAEEATEHGQTAAAHGDAHGAEKAKAPTGHSAQAMKAATAVAHDENPENIEKPVVATNRLPSSLPKQLADSKGPQYTVQVASFPSAQEAQKLVNEMKAKNMKSAFYVAAKVKDRKTASEKTWYRVHAGMFRTQPEADKYKKEILTNSKVPSAIVTKVND